jgi:protease I
MEFGLKGRRVAILATDGVEQVELEEPWRALERAGADVRLVAPKAGKIQAFKHHDKGDTFDAAASLDDVSAADFDALVLPGGVINPDQLRMNRKAVNFVRDFIERDKPVAAICHGPWLLVEADAVRGRTLTSWPSLQTDIRNAGGSWVDQAVVVDQKLITSRKPDDLPHFTKKILVEFANRLDEEKVDALSEMSFPASDPPPGPGAVAS